MPILPGFFGGGGQINEQAVKLQNEGAKPPEEWASWYWDLVRSNPASFGYNYDVELKHLDPQVQAQTQQSQQQALAEQITQAQQSNVAQAPTPAPAGPSPEEELATLRSGALTGLSSALPPGFEQSYVPSTATDPFEEAAYTTQRSVADTLIANMLKRGVLTEAGRAKGIQSLESQTPGIRGRLGSLGDLLIEQERAGLRGIASEGRAAAESLQPGQTFDPETYRGRVAERAGSFTQGLPTAYAAQVPGGLFSTGGLADVTGAASGQPEPFDPYAGAEGQLTTGLEEPKPPKRKTAVF